MNLKAILINALAGTVESIEETEIEAVLQKLHDSNPPAYEAAIKVELAAISALKPVISAIKSPVVLAIVEGLENAFTQSAAANGIAV